MNIGRMTEEQVDKMMGEILGNSQPKIRKVKLPVLEPTSQCEEELDISLLGDVATQIQVELGRAGLSVREILDLDVGAVIELEKVAGEEVDVYINDRPFVSAEVVIINDSFGIRVNSFLETVEE